MDKMNSLKKKINGIFAKFSPQKWVIFKSGSTVIIVTLSINHHVEMDSTVIVLDYTWVISDGKLKASDETDQPSSSSSSSSVFKSTKGYTKNTSN